MNLQDIQNFVTESNQTNSNTDKLNVLKKYAKNESVCKALNYTYNTFKQYGVTSENCKKNSNLVKHSYSDLTQLIARCPVIKRSFKSSSNCAKSG